METVDDDKAFHWQPLVALAADYPLPHSASHLASAVDTWAPRAGSVAKCLGRWICGSFFYILRNLMVKKPKNLDLGIF